MPVVISVGPSVPNNRSGVAGAYGLPHSAARNTALGEQWRECGINADAARRCDQRPATAAWRAIEFLNDVVRFQERLEAGNMDPCD
jgi:hypothetical protein